MSERIAPYAQAVVQLPVTEYKNETEFRHAVMKDLQELGFMVYAIPDSRRQLGDTGYPDITAVKNKRVVWIECKMKDRKMTDVQWNWCHQLYNGSLEHPSFVLTYPHTWQEDLEIILKG